MIEDSGASVIFTWDGQMEIRRAAKELTVPCVEVLHGTSYSVEGGLGWLTGSEREWPTHVVCLDAQSKSVVERTVPPGVGV